MGASDFTLRPAQSQAGSVKSNPDCQAFWMTSSLATRHGLDYSLWVSLAI